MKATTYTTTGTKDGEVELPLVFSTPFRRELIHKAFTNLTSHKFQPQGRHPSAGQDVVADSNDPPTVKVLPVLQEAVAAEVEDKVKVQKLHQLEVEDKHIHQLSARSFTRS